MTTLKRTPTRTGHARRFAERFATVNGVRLHYRVGGEGPAVVLLHGYAADRPHVAPDHADARRAPHRDCSGPAGRRRLGQARRRLRQEDHGRRTSTSWSRPLGLEPVRIVGHDIGLMVAYAYAAQFPRGRSGSCSWTRSCPASATGRTSGSCATCGTSTSTASVRWRWSKGRERTYLEHFWNDFAADRSGPSRRPIASSTRAPTRSRAPCARASSTSATSSRTRRTSPACPHAAADADARAHGREGVGTSLIEQAKLVAAEVRGQWSPAPATG